MKRLDLLAMPILLVSLNCLSSGNVDFFTSMSSWGTYKLQECLRDQQTMIAKQLYDSYFIGQDIDNQVPKIPKIIHQIWLGGPFPEKYRPFQASWVQMNPSWTYKLWTEKEIDAFGLVNRVAYDKVSNYAAKSDIARIEILYREGGLYVDTDFQCLRSCDEILSLDFCTGCVDSLPFSLLNGMMASRPGHPIIKRYIEMIQNSMITDERDPVKILALTGPRLFTRAFFESLSDDVGACVIFPLTYFYPFPAHLRNMKASFEDLQKQWAKPESFAIHWWECSWQKKGIKGQ